MSLNMNLLLHQQKKENVPIIKVKTVEKKSSFIFLLEIYNTTVLSANKTVARDHGSYYLHYRSDSFISPYWRITDMLSPSANINKFWF